MNAGGSTGGGTSSSIYYNPAMIQEITMEVGAQSVTSETSGVSINVVPREGGNRFSATFIANGTTESLQSNNLNDELVGQGITTPQKNKEIWDLNPGGGGPIKRDKLWFYAAYRNWGSSFYVPGAFFNSAPLEWQPVLDPSRPAYDDETIAHDFEYVATKLDIGVDALRALMNGPNKTYRDYKHSMPVINLGTHALRLVGVQRAIIR